MKQKRHTEITTETVETTVIRFRDSQEYRHCEACKMISVYLTPRQAKEALSIQELQMALMIESGRLHLYKNEGGLDLVCSNSILNFEEENKEDK